MQFRQDKKDGSCDMVFTEEEIKIINKNKKLHFSATSLKHFGNVLVRMVAEWQLFFTDEVKSKETREDDIVEGK
jgi:hypothetical protein|tara:strand:- start:301 stop:522 length:222 start_codon:yes stop_codon:yes gene_type:complete